jgi:phosphate transport system substrate-binding protein
MKPSLFVAALATNMLIISVAMALDQDLPAYQTVSGISGKIESVGSDILNNVMMLWAKGSRIAILMSK